MFHSFVSPFVWWEKVKRHQEIKESILPEIDKMVKEFPEEVVVPQWNCEVYSSFGKDIPLLKDKALRKEIVWDPLDACLAEVRISLTAVHSQISEMWFNQYEDGFFQEVHDHGESSFSGIYLLDLNEPNTTAFFNQGKTKFLQETVTTEDIEEGHVIIFPSSLPHYVNPCRGKRTTLSFNVFTQFE